MPAASLQRADLEHAASLFEALRKANLRVLRGLPPESMKLSGIHTSRGEEDLAQMIRQWAGHDLLHLDQIARIRSTTPISTEAQRRD